MATSAVCGTSLMTCAYTSCMCRQEALEIVNVTDEQADADLTVRRPPNARFACCYEALMPLPYIINMLVTRSGRTQWHTELMRETHAGLSDPCSIPETMMKPGAYSDGARLHHTCLHTAQPDDAFIVL